MDWDRPALECVLLLQRSTPTLALGREEPFAARLAGWLLRSWGAGHGALACMPPPAVDGRVDVGNRPASQVLRA